MISDYNETHRESLSFQSTVFYCSSHFLELIVLRIWGSLHAAMQKWSFWSRMKNKNVWSPFEFSEVSDMLCLSFVIEWVIKVFSPKKGNFFLTLIIDIVTSHWLSVRCEFLMMFRIMIHQRDSQQAELSVT